MFDSGMGGLTVLHECLVQLPGEHFAYVGDTARFPYGEKSPDELELFSRQITAFLETVPGQAHRRRLLLGHVGGAAGAAGAVRDADHRRGHAGGASRRGELALPQDRRARHGGHGGERRLSRAPSTASTPAPRSSSRRAPGLVDFIEAGDVASQALADAVRGFTEPLKAQRPDVVIMGCTHYPLIAPMLQRFLGRDVTLINPAAEIAREVEAMLLRQGLERPGDAMGSYRFYTTGDVERFRSTGARFLQMPLTRVRALPLERLGELVAP